MKDRPIYLLACFIMTLALFSLTQRNVAAREAGQGFNDPAPLNVYLPLVTRPGSGEAPTIRSFVADPARIESGGASTITWEVVGATGLTISPGIGAVSGTSVVVHPTITTQYTLTATNAQGSTQAQVTVTVVDTPSPTGGGFFIVPTPAIELPTSHPTVKVDAAGGVHVVFTPQSATQANPTRPAYYAYCPARCTSAAAFTILPLGDGVDFAALGLDPAGHPRLLARTPTQSGAVFVYQYWACDGNCLNPAQWRSGYIGYSYARQVGWVEPFVRSFALDPQGRPRFVYYDAGENYEDPHRGVFYAFCDSDCTDAGAWRETRLLDDVHARDFALAFSPTGQPRLAYATYDSDALTQPVAYAECNRGCHVGSNWSGVVLADTVSASVTHFATFALSVNTAGKPRLALYTGTRVGGSLTPDTLYYLACDAPQTV